MSATAWTFPSDEAELVVSAENNFYLAWQSRLFDHSARTRLATRPLVVVHETGLPLHSYFSGLQVLEAPSFRGDDRNGYPPRNKPGSLLHAARAVRALRPWVRTIVLCDPDMIFTRSPKFPAGFAAESYPGILSGLGQAAGRLRFAISRATAEGYTVGAPYCIPVDRAERLAIRWLEILDALRRPGRVHMLGHDWCDEMLAFAFAAWTLGMKPEKTHEQDMNLDPRAVSTRPIIHYGWGGSHEVNGVRHTAPGGTPGWNKRMFSSPESDGSALWHPRVEDFEPGSVTRAVLEQLVEARP